MGYCIPARAPNQVTVVRVFQGNTISQTYALGFNAAKHVTTYRLDWTTDYIKWYVNGLKMHELKQSDFNEPMIPTDPLRMKIFVVPRHRQNFAETSPFPVDIFMRLFRVQYRSLAGTTSSTSPIQIS